MKTLFSALVLLSTLFTAATIHAQEGASAAAGGTSVAPLTYVLKPIDIIRVEVYQEEDLRREVRIEADGTVTLPLIGKVSVGGMRVGDVQALITELYDRDYIVEPHVTVSVLSYSEQRVQVLGQVNAPGFVLIPPEEGMTISQAISGARGFTRLASTSSVQVRRKKEDGETEVYEVDVNQILRNPDAFDFPLKNKDIIFVKERIF